MSWFTAFAASPSGAWLAAGGGDGELQMWRRDGGLHVACAGGAPGKKVRCLAWDATGKYIAMASGLSVVVWDALASQRSGSAGSTGYQLVTRSPTRLSHGRAQLPIALAWRSMSSPEWKDFKAQLDGVEDASNATIQSPATILAVAFSDGIIKLFDISVYRQGDAVREMAHKVPSAVVVSDVAEMLLRSAAPSNERFASPKPPALASAHLMWTGDGGETPSLSVIFTDPNTGDAHAVVLSHTTRAL